MSLNSEQRRLVETFRSFIEAGVGERLGLGPLERIDRADFWTLVSRWSMDAHSWLEIVVRPGIPQVQVGLATEDPDRDRDFEQLASGAGLTVAEYVQKGFKAEGLDWPNAPVVRFREHARRYCCVTPMDLSDLGRLDEDAVMDRVFRMASGYHRCLVGGV